MTIKEMKRRMLKFKDFYGGDFLDSSDIIGAKNTKELNSIIERQRHHMEDMLSDAHSHLDSFKRKLGIGY
jgi:hypothetical protein